MDRRTVVVVEDEPLIPLEAAGIFEAAGIDLVAFADGDAALDYIRDHRADVAALFTDVYLPGSTDGLELASFVAEACPEVAVFVTAGAPRAARLPAEGRVRCVPKPWRPRELLASMQGALRAA